MSRETFRRAAKNVDLGEKIAMRNYDYIASNIEDCLEQAAKELYDEGFLDIQDIKGRICSLVNEKRMRQ